MGVVSFVVAASVNQHTKFPGFRKIYDPQEMRFLADRFDYQ